MKHIILPLIVLLGGCTINKVALVSYVVAPSDTITEFIQGLPAELTFGVVVYELDEGQLLYEYNGYKLFTPASTLKLITAATTLAKLGTNYRFRTYFFKHGDDIYVKGTGDPLLLSKDIELAAREIKWYGIDSLRNIFVDESYFDTIRKGKGWMWDEGPRPFNPNISALNVNYDLIEVIIKPSDVGNPPRVRLEPSTNFVVICNNAVTIDSGETTIEVDRVYEQTVNKLIIKGELPQTHDELRVYRTVEEPALYVGHLLKENLERIGVKVYGSVLYGVTPAEVETLWVHYSPCLSKIVLELNKWSSNFIAEHLLKAIGAELKGVPGTADKGLTVVEEFLEEIGINSYPHKIVDGSGLSRYNLISPYELVQLLIYVYRQFSYMYEFVASLPIGGIDGTLRNRFESTPYVVRAKTGTMTGVSGLAGYTMTENGHLLAFAMMTQGYTIPIEEVRTYQDSLLQIIRSIY